MENQHISWENPQEMAIFHSYVSPYQRVPGFQAPKPFLKSAWSQPSATWSTASCSMLQHVFQAKPCISHGNHYRVSEVYEPIHKIHVMYLFSTGLLVCSYTSWLVGSYTSEQWYIETCQTILVGGWPTPLKNVKQYITKPLLICISYLLMIRMKTN